VLKLKMSRNLIVLSLSAITTLVACGQSNPLIGKWSLDDGQAGLYPPCSQSVEFFDNSESLGSAGPGDPSMKIEVTYKNNGSSVDVINKFGIVSTVTIDGSGIRLPSTCHYHRA
jgi:hypothetical protein